MTPRRPYRTLAAAALAAVTLTVAGAAKAATDTTTADSASHDTTHDAGSVAPVPSNPAEADPVCEPLAAIDAGFNSQAPDPAALTTAIDDVEAKAPADIAEPLATMVAAARAVLDSGGQDFSAFEDPAFGEADSTVDQWAFEHCIYEHRLAVTLADFEFMGIPDELPAGQTAILATNEGAESHELLILRKNDGVTETWDELLALPEEEAMTKAAFVGAGFAPTKGMSTVTIADLTPGDYVAVCFVATGTSMTNGEMTEGTGPPHFTAGMIHEFTVQ